MAEQDYLKSIFTNAASVGKKLLSVELFSHLPADLELFKKINPGFCSLTAWRGDVENFDELPAVALIKKLQEQNVNVMVHVSGRNYNREEALLVMNNIKNMGIKNILALKGGSHIKEEDDSKCEYPYALEFLRFLREEYQDYFNIGTTGYPIGHPSSPDPDKEIGGYLKEKVKAGADFIVCQGVFDLETFKKFYRRCREEQIEIPIVASVYAINSYATLKYLMTFCKVLPEEYLKNMEELQVDTKAITDYSVKYMSDLIRALLKDEEISITGVHVNSFGNLALVKEIFDKLDYEDLKIWQPEQQ